jgi:hypothetical protein
MKRSYPDILPDQETGEYSSGYTAGIVYDCGHKIEFPGVFYVFDEAVSKAGKISAALFSTGQTGIKIHVGFHGARPQGFPQNGVTRDAWSQQRPMVPKNYDAPMTGAEFSNAAKILFGRKHGARNYIADMTGVTTKTIERQMSAEEVDPTMSRLVRCLLAMRPEPKFKRKSPPTPPAP